MYFNVETKNNKGNIISSGTICANDFKNLRSVITNGMAQAEDISLHFDFYGDINYLITCVSETGGDLIATVQTTIKGD